MSLYGKVLYEMGSHAEALEMLERAFELETDESKAMNRKEALYYRGITKKALGKKDFLSDIKQSADEGSEKAAQLLEELS